MIPKNFEKEVRGHIGRSVLANKNKNMNVPLILCISGPPGMGKTFQTHKILNEMGVAVCDLPGSFFENENAGAPAEAVQDCYRRASTMW